MDEMEVNGLDPVDECPSDGEVDSDAEDIHRDLTEEDTEAPEVDWAELITRDTAELRREFPELSGLRDITELHNPMRYASLRDLGLTPAEAYLATRKRVRQRDNRQHLSAAVARATAAPGSAMTRREMAVARELFSGMSDADIQSLYKRVKN